MTMPEREVPLRQFLFGRQHYSFAVSRSLTSLTTTPDRRNRAIRLGMAIMPLKVSAMSHSSPRSMVAPTMDTRE